MTNDIYINRVAHKSDQDNKAKFCNFVERNNDFFNKKKLRLFEKIKKISDEADLSDHFIPNKKTFTKADLRNPQQFYEDQKNFVLLKAQNIQTQREEKIKLIENETHRHIPEINKYSKNIIERKTCSHKKNEVFIKLYNQRNKKKKKILFDDFEKNNLSEKENQEANTQNNFNNNPNKNPLDLFKNKNQENVNYSLSKGKSRNNNKQRLFKLKGFKKSKEELQFYSNKLHEDAKKILERKQERIKKIYEKTLPDMQCRKTKLMNVEKFVKTYKIALNKLFRGKAIQSESRSNYCKEVDIFFTKLTLSDYCFILKTLGFIRNDFENIKSVIEMDIGEEYDLIHIERIDHKKEIKEKFVNADKKTSLLKKQIKKEMKLIKNSWNIISSNSDSKKENKILECEVLDSRNILIFLCVIQGYLKGNSNKICENESNEIIKVKVNNLLKKIQKSNSNLIEEINFDKKSKSQEKNFIMKGNLKIMEHTMNKLILENSDNYHKNHKQFLSEDEHLNICSEVNKNSNFNRFKRIKSKEAENKLIENSPESMDVFKFNISF